MGSATAATARQGAALADDGIAIEARRATADRRAIARIPVQPQRLDLEALAQSITQSPPHSITTRRHA